MWWQQRKRFGFTEDAESRTKRVHVALFPLGVISFADLKAKILNSFCGRGRATTIQKWAAFFFRRVRHPNVIKLLGTFQASRGVPGFIVEPGLFRARRELFGFKVRTCMKICFWSERETVCEGGDLGKRTEPILLEQTIHAPALNLLLLAECDFSLLCSLILCLLVSQALPRRSKGKNMLLERCRRILEQVGIALEHLHRKGLVHMELSLDTVMVRTRAAPLTQTRESHSRGKKPAQYQVRGLTPTAPGSTITFKGGLQTSKRHHRGFANRPVPTRNVTTTVCLG